MRRLKRDEENNTTLLNFNSKWREKVEQEKVWMFMHIEGKYS